MSGNPKGRPKGSLNRSTIARKWLSAKETSANPITKKSEKLSQEDFITLAQINKARKGDTAAYRAVMDSAYGTSGPPDAEVQEGITVNVIF